MSHTDALQATFCAMVLQNPLIPEILAAAQTLGLPRWYLAAGCLSQTVWNIQAGRAPDANIHDYDLVYFDPDLSWEAEDRFIQAGAARFGDLPVEIRNQARVHLWYPERFGQVIPPFLSPEAAIARWPATCTCTAVTVGPTGLQVYAPYGLDDLMQGVVRPNPTQPENPVYRVKALRWQAIWPHLRVIPYT
jgi:hypothetical protein